MDLKAFVRRMLTGGKQGLGVGMPPSLDFTGALGMNAVLAPKALRTAAGVRYGCSMGSATLLAPVTAWPTTTATMGLYNDSDDRCFFIDSVGYHLGSGTPTAGSALVIAVVGGIQTRPTASTGSNGGYAGSEIANLNGRGSPGGSKAMFATALTLLKQGDANPAWQVACGNPGGVGLAAATFPAHLATAELNGGFIVPPRGILAMAILSGTGTTPLFGFQASWDELPADLE